MPTYTAEFRTDADYATRDFKARSPQEVLKQARAFYDERSEELIFERYDGHSLNEVAVRDADGRELAVWQDNELRLRLAAGDMLEALELCADCLADLARLDDGTPSISALTQARAAIAKGKPETVAATIVGAAQPLPLDPGKIKATAPNGRRWRSASSSARPAAITRTAWAICSQI